MIQKFNDTDGVTVFDYDEKIKDQVESGVICLTFTILGSKTTVPLAAVKSIDGRKNYTIGSIWKLTGQKEEVNIEVEYTKKHTKVRTNLI